MRPDGDGEQLSFLKIVAGIAGLPLDELIQRDAQRRIRRVTFITGGALAAMLVMAIMTTLAIQARNEVARQRAAAEGLVEYMLTDLREELRGVGRLEVMDAVNERAMNYYQGQGDVSLLADDSVERRARILHAMGEDYEKQGDLDKALAKFSEAHASTAILLEREPQNRNRMFAHAQSEYWLGYMAYRNKDRATTLSHFGNYRAVANRLIASDPQNPKWVREGGYAEGNLCSYYLERPPQPDKAIGHCQAALLQMQKAKRLMPKNPQAQIDVINRLNWLVDANFAAGAFAEALKSSEALTQAADELVRLDPHNADYAEMAIRAQITAGKARFRAGHNVVGLAKQHQARKLLARLQKIDPANDVWKRLTKQISSMAEQ